jgi:hypothetical protein
MASPQPAQETSWLGDSEEVPGRQYLTLVPLPLLPYIDNLTIPFIIFSATYTISTDSDYRTFHLLMAQDSSFRIMFDFFSFLSVTTYIHLPHTSFSGLCIKALFVLGLQSSEGPHRPFPSRGSCVKSLLVTMKPGFWWQFKEVEDKRPVLQTLIKSKKSAFSVK